MQAAINAAGQIYSKFAPRFAADIDSSIENRCGAVNIRFENKINGCAVLVSIASRKSISCVIRTIAFGDTVRCDSCSTLEDAIYAIDREINQMMLR